MTRRPRNEVQTRRMLPARKMALVHWLMVLALAFVLVSTAPAMAKKPSAADGESRYAKLDLGPGKDRARVHYKSYGKGREALVLIHGWTCNLNYWREQIPDFAKRNRVIAIDLPGHGLSDKPQVAYSMDLFARAVEAVMRDAKVDWAVLVGHSMGT